MKIVRGECNLASYFDMVDGHVTEMIENIEIALQVQAGIGFAQVEAG
jgi:hypothetical protein